MLVALLTVILTYSVVALYVAHPFVAGVVTLWALSLLVSALPVPTATSSSFYKTLFRLLQIVVAELRGFIKLRFPVAPLPPELPADIALPAPPKVLLLAAPSNVLQMPSPAPQTPSDAA